MIPAISGALGSLNPSEWSISPIDPTAGAQAAGGVGSVGSTDGPSKFGDVLANAIGSLENTQAVATTDAQNLATGQIADPTQAVTSVENASLEMDLAAKLRDQFTGAVNTVFQTQA
jgi:flagellar hook-basal body complex protein FliE